MSNSSFSERLVHDQLLYVVKQLFYVRDVQLPSERL